MYEIFKDNKHHDPYTDKEQLTDSQQNAQE